MPAIFPIERIEYSDALHGGEVSDLIAPPYDVLDEGSKAKLLAKSPHNIVAVDLPHLPPKTVGPPETYARAGEKFRQWLDEGVLVRGKSPRCYVYAQTYDVKGRRFRRMGLIAALRVQPFGENPDGHGAILAHEQTFSNPKEDRLRLMEATRAQLSPIFGLYGDDADEVRALLEKVARAAAPTFRGTTDGDGVLHEAWAIEDENVLAALTAALAGKDVFIADGHHRYTTAINYLEKVRGAGKLPDNHPANFCMFVLVAIQDPGMIILPTHRALGGMESFTFEAFAQAAKDDLRIEPFEGADIAALDAALPGKGAHAMGLVHREGGRARFHIATPRASDPLAATHGERSEAWRQLDVAILQHLVVEKILQPVFRGGGEVDWKFPHALDELLTLVDGKKYQLGAVMQPTPLDSVRRVSEAGELMPQKSTFFYPKLATGLVVKALE